MDPEHLGLTAQRTTTLLNEAVSQPFAALCSTIKRRDSVHVNVFRA